MIEMQNTLNERKAGKYLGVSAAVLRLWRSEGKGPCYFSAREKHVLYHRAYLPAPTSHLHHYARDCLWLEWVTVLNPSGLAVQAEIKLRC